MTEFREVKTTTDDLRVELEVKILVTGEYLWKYCHILGILNHLSRNSTPASDDQYSSKF